MRQLSLRLCVLFVLLFTGASALMAQQLVPGDIAIIGVHTNSPNSFIVVALKDVQPGQVITFTDNAWISASNNFQTAEGYLEWTLTSGLSAGATATFTYSSSWSVATGSLNPGGTFAFNNSGDQIIAFAGDWANRPTTGSDTKFLWAFSMCNFGYLPVSPNFSSDCPSVLANYSTALNTSSSPFRNAFFANGLTQVTQLTLSGTKTNFATAFFDKYKFRKTTSIEAFPAYTFTVRTDADTANHLVFVNFPTSGYPNTNLNSFTVEARNSSEQVVKIGRASCRERV